MRMDNSSYLSERSLIIAQWQKNLGSLHGSVTPTTNALKAPSKGRSGPSRHAILAARDAVYAAARERHPTRWSGPTRDWSPIGAVTLNPERDAVVAAAAGEANKQLSPTGT